MTVLLVLCTLLLFLVADYIVQRVRMARLAAAQDPVRLAGSQDFPADAQLLVNHTWMRRDERGNILLGLDGLLARALGTLERVLLPEPGTAVRPATSDITLAAGGHSLELAVPVEGRVVEVNRALFGNPMLARDDPYGRGWLVKIHPLPDHNAISSAYVVRRPAEWLSSQREQMREFFLACSAQLVPATLQDGGEPVEGVLRQFDEEVWRSFNQTFLTLCRVEPVPDTPGERIR